MRPSVYYFAYGSNMHPTRFTHRVPSAEPVEPGVLEDHALYFHKRGRDGSGKCNILFRPGGLVLGVVYRIARSHQRDLDRIEGQGYVRTCMEIHGWETGDRYQAYCYRARSVALDHRLHPYDWYKELVVSGAEHHGLPRAYLDFIRQIPSRADANHGRRRRHSVAIPVTRNTRRSRRPMRRLPGRTPKN